MRLEQSVTRGSRRVAAGDGAFQEFLLGRRRGRVPGRAENLACGRAATRDRRGVPIRHGPKRER